LRAQGLRPIQIWVPDTRSPRFAAQASRQSRLVASSRHATEDQTFRRAVLRGPSDPRRGLDRCGRQGLTRASRGSHPNFQSLLKLSPRIIVFRAFVDQLPKLDVAGSTPVARSLFRNAPRSCDAPFGSPAWRALVGAGARRYRLAQLWSLVAHPLVAPPSLRSTRRTRYGYLRRLQAANLRDPSLLGESRP
jgi:hypothetical protein